MSVPPVTGARGWRGQRLRPRASVRAPFIRNVLFLAGPIASAAACPSSAVPYLGATGTIEVVEVDLAPSSAGRVTRVAVEEGDHVAVGDTLVVMTQPTLPGDLAARRARVAAAAQTLRELENGARPAEVARAEADLRAAEAEAVRTAQDLERATSLAAQHIVSAQQLDAARSAGAMTAGRRDAARDALQLLREGTRPERVKAARAELAAAQAAVTQSEGTAADLVLVAPVSGVVLGRHVEPGETLTPGEAAVTIGDTTHPWVRLFVDEKALPAIHLGATATAVLDGDRRHFSGRVVAINPRAEFTPRIALTERERADLVFGVKVALDDTTGTLRPGLPITVSVAPSTHDVPLGVPNDRSTGRPVVNATHPRPSP